MAMVSGGPTQVQLSPTTAAGMPPTSTVGTPGPITGPPTCGMGLGKAGVCMGHVCMSVMRAANAIDHTAFPVLRVHAKGCVVIPYMRLKRTAPMDLLDFSTGLAAS
jgi:hypothetical protein